MWIWCFKQGLISHIFIWPKNYSLEKSHILQKEVRIIKKKGFHQTKRIDEMKFSQREKLREKQSQDLQINSSQSFSIACKIDKIYLTVTSSDFTPIPQTSELPVNLKLTKHQTSVPLSIEVIKGVYSSTSIRLTGSPEVCAFTGELRTTCTLWRYSPRQRSTENGEWRQLASPDKETWISGRHLIRNNRTITVSSSKLLGTFDYHWEGQISKTDRVIRISAEGQDMAVAKSNSHVDNSGTKSVCNDTLTVIRGSNNKLEPGSFPWMD